MLAVDPESQSAGIGKALLTAGLKEADSRLEHCYLETHRERNLRFYGEHGFTIALEGDVPGGGPHVWCLERFPRPK
jgi:ribosomal protein S18 acetylase RimI-like enzyme